MTQAKKGPILGQDENLKKETSEIKEEKGLDSFSEEEKETEKAETKEKDLTIDKEARGKIEKMELDDTLKLQASAQAQSVKLLDDEGKIKKLLEIAKEKGVIYAINVAKKMNDPYILDRLHDTLAKGGHYKEFLK